MVCSHRKSFPCISPLAYRLALLALVLQLLALPLGTHHQAARLASGLSLVCTSLGLSWVTASPDGNPDSNPLFSQAHCPLCSITQQPPALGSAPLRLQTPAGLAHVQAGPEYSPAHVPARYPTAVPRAPPLSLHSQPRA